MDFRAQRHKPADCRARLRPLKAWRCQASSPHTFAFFLHPAPELRRPHLSIIMGRRRSQDFNLPPRMHRKGETFYYVTSTVPRKWIKLGKDLHQARLQWAALEGEASSPDDKTFAIIAKRYEREIIPGKELVRN